MPWKVHDRNCCIVYDNSLFFHLFTKAIKGPKCLPTRVAIAQPAGKNIGLLNHIIAASELVQDTKAIGKHADTGSHLRRNTWVAFKNHEVDSISFQHQGQGEACDAAACNDHFKWCRLHDIKVTKSKVMKGIHLNKIRYELWSNWRKKYTVGYVPILMLSTKNVLKKKKKQTFEKMKCKVRKALLFQKCTP